MASILNHNLLITMAKKTILFFPFNLLSHYLRCLVLADRYHPDEYQIYFISSAEYDEFVLKQGYQVFRAKQFNASEVMRCSRRFDFSWLNPADVEEVMLDQVRAIRELNADVVIGDMAPSLKMAAEITGTHHISLLNAYMTKHYQFTRKISRSHKAYLFLRNFPAPIEEWFTRLGEIIAFKRIQRGFNAIRTKYGLTKISDYLAEMEGNETFVCDSTTLFPLKPLPSSYRVIGPLIYNAAPMDDNQLEEAIAGRPVFCICMGSTGDWESIRFLNDPFYAKYAIVVTGDTNHVLSAPHIVSFPFVNLDQVLQKCKLMICHGGNGTIYSGIKNRVFMLCLPSHFEQEWNISALERIGFGKSAVDYSEETWKNEIGNYAESVPAQAMQPLETAIVFPDEHLNLLPLS